LACVAVFFVEFQWWAVALFAATYSVRVWALTAGYHRYFAHRSYKTSRWFQFVIAWLGASAIQRGPMWWAGEHRHHHKYSDQEGDPHSPIRNSVFWSHIGWILNREKPETDAEGMKDWGRFTELWLLDKYHWVPGVLLGIGCAYFGGATGFVWGFILSTVAVYHVTFCVNSVCHLFGYRTFETTDASRNNWIVALLTFGEGWHNNHHHYQSSTRQGFAWYEIDISYMVLKTLSWVGLVWDLREPTPRALQKNRIGAPKTGQVIEGAIVDGSVATDDVKTIA
jgi:stearoyl-CoA desaturase (delta-9 desaturase)